MNPEFKPPSVPSPEHSTNGQIEMFYQDLKNQIQGEGCITAYDVDIFYGLFESPQNLTADRVEKLFTLLEQAAAAEKFESKQLADQCLGAVGTYRHNFALKNKAKIASFPLYFWVQKWYNKQTNSYHLWPQKKLKL